ncbi:MAG: hypothetical protein ACK42D_01550 [Candidatus Paceibacteria bacterium]
MRQLEELEINALEMLLEIFQRQTSSKKNAQKTLEVQLSDLRNYGFKYKSGEDMRFFEVFNLLKERRCGLTDFKQNDPDLLVWEHNMRYSEKMRGKAFSPAYVITITKTFSASALSCLNDIKTGSKIKPGQVHIYWEPKEYEISSIGIEGSRPYKIKRGKGGTEIRRKIVATIFSQYPNEVKIANILEITGINLTKFQGHISKLNDTIKMKLNIADKDLILYNDDWTILFLNDRDFYFEV